MVSVHFKLLDFVRYIVLCCLFFVNAALQPRQTPAASLNFVLCILFKHCLTEFTFKIKQNQTKYQQVEMTMFMFFRMISGFGVMDQSSSTLTGVLVSRIIQEELNTAW